MPIRCGPGIQNRKPQHLRDYHLHNIHIKQPQSAQWSTHPSPHLRVSRRPQDRAWEKQRGTFGTARTSSKGGTRAQKDQGREWLFSLSGTLPNPRIRQWPVLCHHLCQRGKNLQVRKEFHTPAVTVVSLIHSWPTWLRLLACFFCLSVLFSWVILFNGLGFRKYSTCSPKSYELQWLVVKYVEMNETELNIAMQL